MERGQIKTLGVGWNPQSDIVNFTVENLQLNGKLTKGLVALGDENFVSPAEFHEKVVKRDCTGK